MTAVGLEGLDSLRSTTHPGERPAIRSHALTPGSARRTVTGQCNGTFGAIVTDDNSKPPDIDATTDTDAHPISGSLPQSRPRMVGAIDSDDDESRIEELKAWRKRARARVIFLRGNALICGILVGISVFVSGFLTLSPAASDIAALFQGALAGAAVNFGFQYQADHIEWQIYLLSQAVRRETAPRERP